MLSALPSYIAETLEAERCDLWWSEISGNPDEVPQEYDA